MEHNIVDTTIQYFFSSILSQEIDIELLRDLYRGAKRQTQSIINQHTTTEVTYFFQNEITPLILNTDSILSGNENINDRTERNDLIKDYKISFDNYLKIPKRTAWDLSRKMYWFREMGFINRMKEEGYTNVGISEMLSIILDVHPQNVRKWLSEEWQHSKPNTLSQQKISEVKKIINSSSKEN